MAAFSSIIAAAGLGLSAAGTVMNVMGQQKAAAGAKRAERLREAQMNIEESRSRRQIIRQAVVARGSALSNATSQGAQESSGLVGGISQITNESGGAVTAGQQNKQLGTQMFAANRQISAGQSQSSFGSGLSSLGNGLVSNSEMIGRIGNYFSGRPA